MSAQNRSGFRLFPLIAVWMVIWIMASGRGGAAAGPTISARVEPATVSRGQAVRVTISVDGRVAGDRIRHYMIWTQGAAIPNPLRVEGVNQILVDKAASNEIPLDVAWWPDGAYKLYVRAYYLPDARAPFTRLDSVVTLRVQGGAPPPTLRIRAADVRLKAGCKLVLKAEFLGSEALGRLVDLALVSRGQQALKDRSIPLERQEETLAVATAATAAQSAAPQLTADTAGWRPQRLNCLLVRARFQRPGDKTLTTLQAMAPAITIVGENAAASSAIPSYRGARLIHLITSGTMMNTFAYPTCTSWRRGGREVFFESDRPQPDGAAVKGERQLMMADVATGRLTHLATLGVEDTRSYGPFHPSASSQFHADYAPQADLLAYYDMTGHHLYTLRPGGRPTEVWHERNGRIGDPPAIARDGSRLLFYVIAPGPERDAVYYGRTSRICILDLDPRTGQASGAPRLVLAYPWRNWPVGAPTRASFNFIGCDHVQFCPTDPRRLLYAHEGGYPRNGEPENARIWSVREDGSENHALGAAVERGSYYTHELYGPGGRWVYTVLGGGVARIEAGANRVERIYKAPGALKACHIGVSPDERWIAADIQNGLGEDSDGNPIGGLFLIETATGKATFLAAFPAGAAHPRHIHPNFSPDGRKVGFTLAQGRQGAQIAWIDVADIVAK